METVRSAIRDLISKSNIVDWTVVLPPKGWIMGCVLLRTIAPILVGIAIVYLDNLM